ncbi:MAG TPA: hypothetical protein VM577_05470 [Anaerovoracaceae bacterium]|nr:hypothetical protein [Anaerovoracaceae bacterium]
MFLIVVVLGLIGYLLYKKYKKAKSPGKIPSQDFDVPDTDEFRVAVHEAGHAVAAWFCTAVARVNEVTIESPTGGHVKYEYHHSRFKENDWCNLVICLAGMAGEAVIYKRVRSGPASKDLAEARQMVAHIINAGWQDPPWEVEESSMPFHKMFKDPLSETENRILQQAFQYSKELIWSKIKVHHQFVVLLLKDRTLNRDELIDHFGDREFSFLGNCFRACFM